MTRARISGRQRSDSLSGSPRRASQSAGEGALEGRVGRRRRGAAAQVGRETDPEPDPESVARTIALRRLAVAPQTRAQLADAMQRRGVADEVRDRVLERFTDVGLIDDAMFAQAWVESRHAGRGLAKKALAFELRRRGVEPGVVDLAVGRLGAQQEEATARVLVGARMAGTAGLDPATRTRRLAGMLARKGYPAGLAFRVVRDALAAEGVTEEHLPEEPANE